MAQINRTCYVLTAWIASVRVKFVSNTVCSIVHSLCMDTLSLFLRERNYLKTSVRSKSSLCVYRCISTLFLLRLHHNGERWRLVLLRHLICVMTARVKLHVIVPYVLTGLRPSFHRQSFAVLHLLRSRLRLLLHGLHWLHGRHLSLWRLSHHNHLGLTVRILLVEILPWGCLEVLALRLNWLCRRLLHHLLLHLGEVGFLLLFRTVVLINLYVFGEQIIHLDIKFLKFPIKS